MFIARLYVMVWLWLATKAPHHTAAPPPAGVRRRMERNRRKPVGQDKGSLTEQETKGTGITMMQIRRKTQHKPHNPKSRSPILVPHAPELRKSSRRPAPPHRNPA